MVVASAVIDQPTLAQPPTVLRVPFIHPARVRVIVDNRIRRVRRPGREDRRQKISGLQCDRIPLRDVRPVVNGSGSKLVRSAAFAKIRLKAVVGRRAVAPERETADRRAKVSRRDRAGAIRRRAAAREIQRFTEREIVRGIAEVADARDLDGRAERQNATIAERVTILQADERIVLRLVVVGRRRLAALDVVRDLKRSKTVRQGRVEEIRCPDRQGEVDELIAVAEGIMR